MGQAVVNINNQKRQYVLPSWGITREIDNMGARRVKYDDAMRKGTGCSGLTQKRHRTKVVARDLSSKEVMNKLKCEG